MAVKIILEGLILGGLMIAACAWGIRNGAVNMVFLYHQDVQDRCVENKLITREQIRKNAKIMKIFFFLMYFAALWICVDVINKAEGFFPRFWQTFAILSIVNLIDRFLIDEYWVGHTDAWLIPGTEDMRTYINEKDKKLKWLAGTVGYAICAALLAGLMTLVLK